MKILLERREKVPYEYEGGRIEEEDAYLCLFCDSVLLCCPVVLH